MTTLTKKYFDKLKGVIKLEEEWLAEQALEIFGLDDKQEIDPSLPF